jgi:hypothetical protein
VPRSPEPPRRPPEPVLPDPVLPEPVVTAPVLLEPGVPGPVWPSAGRLEPVEPGPGEPDALGLGVGEPVAPGVCPVPCGVEPDPAVGGPVWSGVGPVDGVPVPGEPPGVGWVGSGPVTPPGLTPPGCCAAPTGPGGAAGAVDGGLPAADGRGGCVHHCGRAPRSRRGRPCSVGGRSTSRGPGARSSGEYGAVTSVAVSTFDEPTVRTSAVAPVAITQSPPTPASCAKRRICRARFTTHSTQKYGPSPECGHTPARVNGRWRLRSGTTPTRSGITAESGEKGTHPFG